MAKLNTPSHQCAVTYVGSNGMPTGQHCPYRAFRRGNDGKWYCRKHLRDHKPGTATCEICGWPYLAGGECQRPELHWTAASLAEDAARRQARRAERR